jgi:hypothetical protein
MSLTTRQRVGAITDFTVERFKSSANERSVKKTSLYANATPVESNSEHY